MSLGEDLKPSPMSPAPQPRGTEGRMLLPSWEGAGLALRQGGSMLSCAGTHTELGQATREVSLFCVPAERSDSSPACDRPALVQCSSVLGLSSWFSAIWSHLNPHAFVCVGAGLGPHCWAGPRPGGKGGKGARKRMRGVRSDFFYLS